MVDEVTGSRDLRRLPGDSMSMKTTKITLHDTATEVWIEIGNIAVRVLRTDEGALCDMYNANELSDSIDEAHRGSCYVFFNEVDGGE